jgi:hypothetical protein
MAASVGVAAYGTALTWVGNPVVELDNIDITGSNGDEIDITNHDSPDTYKEYVLGLLDGGTLTCTGNFVPSDTTGQYAMILDHYSRTSRAWVITYTDGGAATLGGNGYVKSFRVTAPVAGKLGVEFVIRITGKPLLTP